MLLRRKSIASGGASAHCFPGDRHAWPKVSAPTARAPARWRRSTAGVVGCSGVAPVAFRRKSRSEKWRRRQRDENAFSVIHVRWRYAKALHKYHFFGHADYRNTLRLAVCSLVALGREAVGVFGPPEHHPMTRDIVRSVKHAVDEQLDWTLDDFPAGIRAVLLQQNYYGQA